MAEILEVPAENEIPSNTVMRGSPETDASKKKLIRRFKQGAEQCKQFRRKLVSGWQTNIDYRRGKPFAGSTDQDRIAVPLDWGLTKEKEAQLFSQVPAVRLNHPPQTLAEDAAPWVHRFEQKLNDTAIVAGIESAMNEILPDCINAAGLGVTIVAREAITDTVMLPAVDLSLYHPEMQMMILQSGLMPDGSQIPREPTPRVLDSRYTILRVSPADFLWPLGFTGSDFDMAPWVGRSGRISWPEAIQRFGLSDDEKKKVLGDSRSTNDRLDKVGAENESDEDLFDETVSFDELFYKEFHYDSNSNSFSTIHHLVFVEGKEDPVVDAPWEGQREDPESKMLVGSIKYPIRVLTLAYITDDAIPPSDSAIGRPQVDEINKSRTQMIKQRERSIPIRWFDVNRVDPTIQYSLMRGIWQGMIPVQGVGSNVIGEVSRAGMSQENFTFDRIAKNDLNESWQVGSGLWGQDIETKAESQAVGSSMQVRIARERAKVGKFFLGIMEVLGGLLSIFEDPATIGEGFTPVVSRALSYSVLADSTVLLDSNQRLEKLIRFINFTAKSGWVDIESVLKEIAALSGLDPSVVIRPPQPKPPVEPNISLRMTGIQDMLNPLVLATLMKSGQAPPIELIEEAKRLIAASVAPPIESQLGDGSMGLPEPPPPRVGNAEPDWSALDRINQRVLDRGSEQ